MIEDFEIITRLEAVEKYDLKLSAINHQIRNKLENGLESSILMFGNKLHFRTDRLEKWLKEKANRELVCSPKNKSRIS